MSSKGNPVILHIYEVPQVNKYIFMATDKFGVYHTGVEVFKAEYSFGGHPGDFTGIFITPPKDISSLSVDGTFTYKESKVIGTTDKTEEEVLKLKDEMGSTEFKGKNYDLIKQNCNHFSNAFCKRLCGKEIPVWVNSMVNFIARYPILARNIPKEYTTPKALDKKVKEHDNQEKIKKKKQEQTIKQKQETVKTKSPNSEKTQKDSNTENKTTKSNESDAFFPNN